jgi:hypothetical protein
MHANMTFTRITWHVQEIKAYGPIGDDMYNLDSSNGKGLVAYGHDAAINSLCSCAKAVGHLVGVQ